MNPDIECESFYSDPKYFEFIMADKTVEMETSLDAFIPNMKVKKSIENTVFYDYIQFINSKKQEADILKKQNNTEELKKLDTKVKDYQKKLVAENPFYAFATKYYCQYIKRCSTSKR